MILSDIDAFTQDIVKYFVNKLGYNKDIPKEMVVKLNNAIIKEFGVPLYPSNNDSIAIAIDKPKTAALLFDRIYKCFLTPLQSVPDDIAFYGGTKSEVLIYTLLSLIFKFKKKGIEFDSDGLTKCILPHIPKTWVDILESIKVECDPKFIGLNLISSEFYGIFKRHPVIIYDSDLSFEKYNKPGKEEVLLSAISNIGIVDESELEWAQVLEFRRDADNRIKYIRLMRWMESLMQLTSETQMIDEIAIKLDDYEWALKKHGIKTIMGGISKVLDKKFLLGVGIPAYAATFAFDQFLISMISGSILIGNVAISIINEYIDMKDKIRSDSYELAYIYEVKKMR